MQYAHGGDIYTYKNLLDFSINVNPLGPADAVVEAAARSLQRIGEYPDSQSRELRNALAEKKGLAAEQFVIGNGAADLLFSLVLAEKPQKAMIVIPAFSEYEQALKTVGCEILYHEVKKENNFRLGTDLTEKITSELDFLFLCSPSNPAGQAVEKEFLIKIAEKCEKERVRLVLDECFVQFLTSGEEASMQLETGRFRYLFVLQAFTKIYAVPGIRLGYDGDGTSAVERINSGTGCGTLSIEGRPQRRADTATGKVRAGKNGKRTGKSENRVHSVGGELSSF